MYVHMKIANPGVNVDYRENFRFKVVQTLRTAFQRQLSESIGMKNSPAVILNLKKEYARCHILDIPLENRRWQEVGPQRALAEIDPKVVQRKVKYEMKKEPDERMLIQRQISVSFTRRKKRKSGNRAVYVKFI